MWAIQRERRHGHIKPRSLLAFHFIGSNHQSRRGLERRAAGVLETFTGLKHGLLANHARATNLLGMSCRVGNRPDAVAELYRGCPKILNRHLISPNIMGFAWRRLILEIYRVHRDFDGIRDLMVQGLCSLSDLGPHPLAPHVSFALKLVRDTRTLTLM